MKLKEKIDAEIKSAILSKNTDRLKALRNIKSLIMLAETEKGKTGELNEERELAVLHKAPATIHWTVSENCEVRSTGKTTEELRERIFAIKDGDIMPDRVDTDECNLLDIMSVFDREFKKQILGI